MFFEVLTPCAFEESALRIAFALEPVALGHKRLCFLFFAILGVRCAFSLNLHLELRLIRLLVIPSDLSVPNADVLLVDLVEAMDLLLSYQSDGAFTIVFQATELESVLLLLFGYEAGDFVAFILISIFLNLALDVVILSILVFA